MIDQQTGHIQFSDTVSIGPHTTEATLLNLMILHIDSKQDIQNGGTLIRVRNIPLDKQYFNFNFTCRDGKLIAVSFVMGELPFPSSEQEIRTEAEELQKPEKYQRWLQNELSEGQTFAWGTVSIIRDPDGSSFIGITYRQTGTVNS